MASGGVAGDFLSPESTVSSLLSSSGHLSSSLFPEHNTTIRYRDKDYSSASEALDAYITDFERSRQHGEPGGRLFLPTGRLSTPARPRTLRNKDVLREQLTDRELDFLTLPVSSVHHRGNRDRLSMTTEELLSIPCDGSMPVTHTSAFIQGLLYQSGDHLLGQCGIYQPRSASRAHSGVNNSHSAPCCPHRTSRTLRSRGGPVAAMVKQDFDVSSLSHETAEQSSSKIPDEFPAPSSALLLPRWVTGHKADMDVSGITGVPDLKYSAWVHRCDPGLPLPPTPRTRAPSWLAELEDDEPLEADYQQTLRNLRFQFAEQICLVAAERRRSEMIDSLLRDDKMESLTQKAEKVLNSPLGLRGEPDSPGNTAPVSPSPSVDPVCSRGSVAVSPANTEELLEDRAPFTHCSRSPVPAGGATDPEMTTEAWGSRPWGNSSRKHPGPVEALKQMLSSLQAMEVKVEQQQQQQQEQLSALAPTHTDKLQMDETLVKQVTESDLEEGEDVPGGPSLQRALHHLGRLKSLVGEPKEKEEGDEDEGLYSC